MRLRTLVSSIAFAAVAMVLVHCTSQYRPLQTADRCACKPSEFCKVTPPSAGGDAKIECAPLPVACSARPTCDCVGDKTDACRDEDGRLTVMPQRAVVACDACSADEYCMDRTAEPSGGRFCRVLPPQCDESRTCACFMETRGASAKIACTHESGRIVARMMP